MRNPGPKEPEAGAKTAALTVNGVARRVRQPVSVGEYLSSLSLDARAVVVEHNGRILRDRETLGDVPIVEGDVLEIVHFVGGG